MRGLLQLELVGPILYAGRQFYQQALQDLRERIPSAEVLLLISTVAAVCGGLYTACHLVLGLLPCAAVYILPAIWYWGSTTGICRRCFFPILGCV